MSELNQRDTLDVREMDELTEAFSLVDDIVSKKYIEDLENYDLVEADEALKMSLLEETASLFKVDKIVYDRNENNLQKLVNTYLSAIGFGSDLVMLINSDGDNVDLYLGTTGGANLPSSRANGKALRGNFIGNFPGSLEEDDIVDNDELKDVVRASTKDEYISISSVSGVASLRENIVDNEKYIQGIEKMIDTMQGRHFSAIFIANIINKSELADIKAEYELIYSKLMPFLKSDLTFNESSSEGLNKTFTESLSKTVSNTKSNALSLGRSKSTAHTEGGSTTHTDTVGVSHTQTASVSIPGGGGSVGASSSVSANYSHSIARSKNWSDTSTFGTTKTQTETIGKSVAEGEIKSVSDGTSKTETAGRMLHISYVNKTIEQLLKQIDDKLERIKESENYGVFAIAGYFLAPTTMESRMAASSYKGLISGNLTYVENASINTWEDTSKVARIKEYLRKFKHPLFEYNVKNQVTPASMISGKELAVGLGIPRKSISGVSVIETASFGRNLIHNKSKKGKYISIGSLYHMGREEKGVNGKIPVELNLNSLAMHTFITGSTGSGKSNAVYSILEKILGADDYIPNSVKFMVIEPAKGEYKDKFGHRNDVRVLGTNSKKTELLRINPFSFPDDVHVLEHIDKLVEIFNVCWPMYAAMPAVLKDAIEQSYVNAGWDLNESTCKYENEKGGYLYPNFEDVLIWIKKVVDDSAYSSDSKGDYTGALSTRVKSLTNGIYGQIFTSDDIRPEELYDENVIVDLSRVGSTETKALIMGLLVMKMQEYRMANRESSDSSLRHVTVLEEAHNLLKKTSSQQGVDSANLMGKSVEMLANSIAEMRTYGEGFIIVDQAPGLLDQSVIRNTNTKIILRLPDMSDRELVGRAAALGDEQIIELSRLKTGVCAVYQNDWIEPVLCHVDYSKSDEKIYKYTLEKKDRNFEFTKLIDYFMLSSADRLDVDEIDLRDLERFIYKLNLPADAKLLMLRYIRMPIDETYDKKVSSERAKIIYELFNSENIIDAIMDSRRYAREAILERLSPSVNDFDEKYVDKILTSIIYEYRLRNDGRISVEQEKALERILR